MKNELTKQEQDLIPEVREKWIQNFLHGESNSEDVRKLVYFCYEISGYKKPLVIVMESPLAMQMAGNLIKVRAQVGAQVRDQVWDQVGAQVWDQVRDQVGAQVGAQVRDQVKFLPTADCYWWVHWSSFYSYFSKIGISTDRFRKFELLLFASRCWELVCYENIVIASVGPQVTRRNTANLLHSDQEPAIEWKDGFKLWYLNGVNFDYETWKKIIDRKFTIRDLMEIKNSDQRAVAVSFLRPDRLLKHVSAKFLNKGTKGTKLYQVDNFLNTGNTEYCMTMTCPSTGRDFLEWVDPEIGKQKDADLAQASSFIDDEGNPLCLEDYLTMQEA